MNFYDDIEVHRLMVGDRVRTDTFRESISATVRPGDVVLDVGAGSGILSLLAAVAGAARVYGIERATDAAGLARKVVADNGLSHRVRIVEADVHAAWLPEPVDVIVSEWLGTIGVDENMLEPVLVARDRWLKPGGSLIPGVVTAWMAPVYHDAGVEGTAFHAPTYGLDLTALAPFVPDEAVALPEGVPGDRLRAKPQQLWSIDPARMPAPRARKPFAAQLTFTLDGAANGLVAWFSAEMPGTARLSNGPGAARTHWGQLLFPIANASSGRRGDELHVDFHCVPSSRGGSQYLWSSQIGHATLEIHDTRRAVRAPMAPPWRVYTVA